MKDAPGARQGMELSALGLALLGLGGCAAPELEVSSSDRPPNIVLIYADDLGYGDLGAQNPDSRIPTPNLDRLAGEGMRFSDAHSSSGVCTPSRYALLTGRHHWRDFHGIAGVFGPSVFPPGRLTLPELLQGRGYRTACIGKWHLGWDWEAIRAPESSGKKLGASPDDFDWTLPIPDGPLAHGFDHYFGDDVPNFPPYSWIEDDRVLGSPTLPFSPNPVPDEGSAECRPGPMTAGWRLDEVMPCLTERAVAWIRSASEEPDPFFLYFSWTSPHAPIVPSPEWKGRTDAGPYGDFVAQSDAALGQVLEVLEDCGVAEDTIVIFASDNGPEHYAYPRSRDFAHRSTGQLRGLKRDIWEGGHRVPLLIRWPGVIDTGSLCESLVSQVDLMATLATASGATIPAASAEDSHDLTPLLRGEPNAIARTSLVHNTRRDHYAIRVNNWLLIDSVSGSVTQVPAWFAEAEDFEANPHEAALFDLENDLGQRDNLVDKEQERVNTMRIELQRIRNSSRTAPLHSGSITAN